MHTARSLDKIAATQDHLGGNTLQHLTISTRLSCRIDESQQLITVDEFDTHDNGVRQALVRHHREVLDLKREEVRRALMLLGWSPPVQVNRRAWWRAGR